MMQPTILAADDDPTILALLRDVFAFEDCRVVGVDDGRMAIEALRLARPDLAILDVMMPGYSGIEVLRAMRADPETRSVPVVMLSAKADERAVWDGFHAGCDHYVPKPFDPIGLAQLAMRMIGQSSSRSRI